MGPDKNSAYHKNRKDMVRRNMSHMMIDMAENDKLDGLGTREENTQEDHKKVSKKPTSSVLESEMVNKPLMQCYPQIADDEHETLLADVRRHWLGRFFIIFGGSALAILMLVVPLILPSLARSIDFTVTPQLQLMVALVFIVISVLMVAGMLISLWVYNQSRMLITDQNVIEVKQISLFSKKISHLNMINVEDVTVIKKGILQTFFDYGTMTTQTAGEQENFIFLNTPTPDLYRRIVINAHEEAINTLGKIGTATKIEAATRP